MISSLLKNLISSICLDNIIGETYLNVFFISSNKSNEFRPAD